MLLMIIRCAKDINDFFVLITRTCCCLLMESFIIIAFDKNLRASLSSNNSLAIRRNFAGTLDW